MLGAVKFGFLHFGVVYRKFSKSASTIADPGGIDKFVFEAPRCFHLKTVKNCFLGPGVDAGGSQILFHTFWDDLIKKILTASEAADPGYKKICF